MFYRTKLFLFGTLLMASLWWLGNRPQNSAVAFYSFEEFTDDMSRVYYDMAHAAYARHDIDTAINACMIALKNKPNFTQAYDLLDHCYEQKKEIRSFLTTYRGIVNDYCNCFAPKATIIEQLETVSQQLTLAVLNPFFYNVFDAATTFMRNNFVDTINKLQSHVTNVLEMPANVAIWHNFVPNQSLATLKGERMYNEAIGYEQDDRSPALQGTITHITTPTLPLAHNMA
jgi:hypothetical protein